MLELLDFTACLPKLHVVTVDQVLGVLFRGVIVGADKLNRPDEVPIGADDVRAMLGHLRRLRTMSSAVRLLYYLVSKIPVKKKSN
jgi:hypothetical protein